MNKIAALSSDSKINNTFLGKVRKSLVFEINKKTVASIKAFIF